MVKLTPRESEILSFVALSIELLGHAPTHREIARRIGCKSRNFIAKTLQNLEAKGLIERDMYRVRGIRVLKQELRDAA